MATSSAYALSFAFGDVDVGEGHVCALNSEQIRYQISSVLVIRGVV